MLSEQANIPATGSNKDETWTLITSKMHHVIIKLFNNYGRPEFPNLNHKYESTTVGLIHIV